jgi:hypothetical protein
MILEDIEKTAATDARISWIEGDSSELKAND